jgi:hypothetical protein
MAARTVIALEVVPATMARVVPARRSERNPKASSATLSRTVDANYSSQGRLVQVGERQRPHGRGDDTRYENDDRVPEPDRTPVTHENGRAAGRGQQDGQGGRPTRIHDQGEEGSADEAEAHPGDGVGDGARKHGQCDEIGGGL